MQDLADFVKVKGGGLLFLSGEHGTPFAYVDTPLADVLPVIPSESAPPRNEYDNPITDGYQPRITPAGRQHPLFRFSPDEAEAASHLEPAASHCTGTRRTTDESQTRSSSPCTRTARPKAVRPARITRSLIQAFVGAGPVLFFGFDDTWRWRYRNDEEHFDRFWMQTMRVLSRSRVRRVELKVVPKTDFRRDEKMTVVVRFPVEAPAPPAGQPVRVTLARGPLTNPDGSSGRRPDRDDDAHAGPRARPGRAVRDDAHADS